MLKHLLSAALFTLVAFSANAQTDAKTLIATGAAYPPEPKTTTTNVVVEKDGKLYVQSTTVNLIETNSQTVSDRIDKLREEMAKLEANRKQLEASVSELQKLFFDLQKKEKKQKKDDEKGR
jgi:septal ring factor EnvC (AmiA/AmiB activator)